MVTETSREERLFQIFEIFKKQLRKFGRNVSLPKNTDPRKTYSWRYLENFLTRYEASELGDEILECAIAAIVSHAAKFGRLNRGIAILDQKDIIKIAKEKLEREVEREQTEITRIRDSHNFVISALSGENEGASLHALLTRRPNKLAYANITRWFKANDISVGYLAVSKTCKKALGTLSKQELSLFPPAITLMKTRLILTCNAQKSEKIREIIGDDLYED